MATRRNASLKPQLNQIRTWVLEGATDIWIAHKLGSTPASIARFRRQHGLTRDAEAPVGDELVEVEEDDAATPEAAVAIAVDESETSVREGTSEGDDADDDAPGRRRRGRRGGRGRSKAAEPLELEGVFDHGADGYGLWLDGAVRDAPVYRRHWEGQSAITVRITADEIVIRRVGDLSPS